MTRGASSSNCLGALEAALSTRQSVSGPALPPAGTPPRAWIRCAPGCHRSPRKTWSAGYARSRSDSRRDRDPRRVSSSSRSCRRSDNLTRFGRLATRAATSTSGTTSRRCGHRRCCHVDRVERPRHLNQLLANAEGGYRQRRQAWSSGSTTVRKGNRRKPASRVQMRLTPCSRMSTAVCTSCSTLPRRSGSSESVCSSTAA